MVERVHRVLKERLMCRSARAADWMSNLPLVLLGLRSSSRDETSVTPAHLVYGTPLRLPGEFFSASAARAPSARTSDFVLQLQHSLRDFRPAQIEFHSVQRGNASVPSALRSSPCVFVHVDAVRRPLTPPYVGPFEVLDRNDKTFVLLRAGKHWTISVDRLKPCFSPVISAPSTSPLVPSVPSSSASTTPPAAPVPAGRHSRQSSSSPNSSVPPAASMPQSPTSRFGRSLRPPDRYVP